MGSGEGTEATRLRRIRRINVLAGLAAGVWTLVFGVSLAVNLDDEHRQVRDLAVREARALFHKDQAFRQWIARQGGIYVPASDEVPPNPYLEHIPERDIETPNGRKLTLMNGAYVMRKVMAEFARSYGVQGRINSLKPLNPVNAPGDWERAGLEAFEEGAKEVLEFTEDEAGDPVLHFMRPMLVKGTCLKCHAHQGYSVGDVRGGVALSVPLAPFLESMEESIAAEALSHAGLWFLGIAGIVWARSRSRRQVVLDLEQEETLHRTIGELTRANTELERFTFVASHDLQEPTRTVVAHAQLLERKLGDGLDAEAREQLGYVIDGGRRMNHLVKDLLAYAETSEIGGEFALINLDKLVRDVVEGLSGALEAAGVEAEVGDLPAVQGDSVQLALLFQHLISNAVKYRGADAPRIWISGTVVDGVKRISVADNGIGIEAEYHQRIFDAFRRLHPAHAYPGTGIGLSICRRIAENHGGRIELESTHGEGSTFTVVLS